MSKIDQECRPTAQGEALEAVTKKQSPHITPSDGQRSKSGSSQTWTAAWKPDAPRVKLVKFKGRPVPLPDHPDLQEGLDLLKKQIGGADFNFVQDLIGQIADAAMHSGAIDERALGFSMSIVTGEKPQSRLEALQLIQMARVHLAFITCASRLTNATTILEWTTFENSLNKLARTFASQLEGFKRCRASSEQKVTVQSVSVSDGGRAIVGNVAQNMAAESKASTKPSSVAITDAQSSPMPIIEQSDKRVELPAGTETTK